MTNVRFRDDGKEEQNVLLRKGNMWHISTFSGIVEEEGCRLGSGRGVL